jgi:hypothetical protein
MKFWASILAAAAVMALGAPVGFAATSSHTSTPSLGAKTAPSTMLGTRPMWV